MIIGARGGEGGVRLCCVTVETKEAALLTTKVIIVRGVVCYLSVYMTLINCPKIINLLLRVFRNDEIDCLPKERANS